MVGDQHTNQVQVGEYPEGRRMEKDRLLEDSGTGHRRGKEEVCGLSREEHECPEDRCSALGKGQVSLLPPTHRAPCKPAAHSWCRAAPDPGWIPRIPWRFWELALAGCATSSFLAGVEFSYLLPPVPTMIEAPLTLLTKAVQVQIAEVSLELRPNHDLLQRQRPRKVRADMRPSHTQSWAALICAIFP